VAKIAATVLELYSINNVNHFSMKVLFLFLPQLKNHSRK